jgi:HAD superfamily hydrolase (TIGR01509 family)
VLVDSEPILVRALLTLAGELGFIMPEAEALPHFRGRKLAECVAEIGERLGHAMPEDFIPALRAHSAAAFRQELRAVEGVAAVLEALDTPFCVASNAPPEKMRLVLELTGLLPHFAGRMFSAYEIGCWKPDPGLFLHAAATMQAAPAACVVVEDSAPGIIAAIAAGMRALHYAGAEHPLGPAPNGVLRFTAMQELPGLLRRRDLPQGER